MLPFFSNFSSPLFLSIDGSSSKDVVLWQLIKKSFIDLDFFFIVRGSARGIEFLARRTLHYTCVGAVVGEARS